MSDANVSVIVDRLIQEGRIKPLIVVCPDVSSSSEEYLPRDIVSYVDGTFRTIPSRESRAICQLVVWSKVTSRGKPTRAGGVN